MTLDAPLPEASSLPSAPYVGLRPFEKSDRLIFFGRDNDAALLRDKVFSARLTILYGPSGIGKSSIVRTLLIPSLEEEEARAVYFDSWRDDDPAATLKAALVEEAKRFGIPNAGAGAPSLTDLVRLLISAEGRTIVLILDQFEEFFTAHGNHLDPLRKELAALVRNSALDVRIVLSLREEHLASLEPFRTEILSLFESTYRLEPLTSDCARAAIEGPAKLFGREYESLLIDQLLADLRAESDQAPTTQNAVAGSPAADLPILQLVCDELWKEARHRSTTNEKQVLSLSLYNDLGGREGILGAFLRRVMPQTWAGRRVTAQLMRYLAPPDGHKLSFSADHLASLTEVPRDQVQRELERLSDPDIRVLRTRSYGQDKVLYELWHDSFIRIIAPWRDDILKRMRNRRRTLRAAAFAIPSLALMIAIVTPFVMASRQANRDYHKNTVEVMGRDDLTPDMRIERVASYLLWTSRFDDLREFLEKHVSELPPRYGVDTSGLDSIRLPKREDEWPLTVHYSSARPLDEFVFAQRWQDLARTLNQAWGIPVPLRLELLAESALPKGTIRLTGRNIEPLELQAMSRESDVYFSSRRLTREGQSFFEHFQGDWTRIPEAEYGGPWWVAPRWSLPVWKTSGVVTYDGSGLPALLLSLQLLKHPERLLTPDAVEVLLRKVAEQYPDTIQEVRAVRGDRLAGDLQEIVRRGYALTNAQSVLDALAAYPDGPSSEITPKASADVLSIRATLPDRLRGPHRISIPASNAVAANTANGEGKVHKAYDDATELIEVKPEIRLHLGKNLLDRWIIERSTLSPDLTTVIETTRDTVNRHFGLEMLGIRILEGAELANHSFRIEMANQGDSGAGAVVVNAVKEKALDRLSAHLKFRVESNRFHLISSELVQADLTRMDPALRSWLDRHYSLTDLKLLLRAVVNPSPEEASRRERALQSGEVGQSFGVPAEHTIRYPAWLLGSLVFWSNVHDPRSLPVLADDLRKTQAARIHTTSSGSADAGITGMIDVGVRSLQAGRIAPAAAAFSRAVASDRDAAVAAFLHAYPAEFSHALVRQFVVSCSDFTQLGRFDRIGLEDLVGEAGFDATVDAATARRLRLCLLASYPAAGHEAARSALAATIVERYGSSVARWSGDEATWLAEFLITSYDPLSQPRSRGRQAFEFLKSVVSTLPQRQESHDLMDKVLKTCQKSGPTAWCWQSLPEIAMTTEDPVITLSIAQAFMQREVPADLELALELLDRAKRQAQSSAMPRETRKYLIDLSDLERGETLVNLTNVGDERGLAEAEKIFRRLLPEGTFGSVPYVQLAIILRDTNRHEEADRVLESALQTKWSDDPDIHGQLLQRRMITGDRQAVSQLAREAWERIQEGSDKQKTNENSGMAFVAALGLLMTETGPWEEVARNFLETDHPYVPYVAMILYSRMSASAERQEDARKVIRRSRGKEGIAQLRARMREADEEAWRKMLLAYYLEEVPRDAIIGDLENDARFSRSDFRSVPLSRRGMLCEAYFYDALLAKVKQDQARERSSLRKVLATRQRSYLEYAMAAFLIEQGRRDEQRTDATITSSRRP